MPLLYHRPLPLLLTLLRTHAQQAHRTRLLFALCTHHDRLALVQLAPTVPALPRAFCLAVGAHLGCVAAREPPPRGSQAGGHEGCARQHKADGAAVDADRGEAGREAVHEAQVREERIGHVLEEEGRAADEVERHSVGAGLVVNPCPGRGVDRGGGWKGRGTEG